MNGPCEFHVKRQKCTGAWYRLLGESILATQQLSRSSHSTIDMGDSVTFLLRALAYPRADGFVPDDTSQFRALLVWLENTKIRQYPIEGRKQLQSTDPAQWHAAMVKYLADLECPVPASDRRAVARWLLTHAVGLEYQDRAEQLNAACSRAQAEAAPPDAWTEREPPPLPDVTQEDVQQQIRQLLGLLQVPTDQGLPAALQQLRDVLELQVLPALAEMAKHAPAAGIAGPTGAAQQQPASAAALRQYPLGFSTGDSSSDLAATILRMLYIKDLRALQTLVDRTIVQVQEYTANPKTDSALGRVGH